MDHINDFTDLWPIAGEYITYIWPDNYSFRYTDLQLTHGSEYQVIEIKYLACMDRIKLVDDHNHVHLVPLYKFSFLDDNIGVKT
jgi:hypothetical protein